MHGCSENWEPAHLGALGLNLAPPAARARDHEQPDSTVHLAQTTALNPLPKDRVVRGKLVMISVKH